VDVKIRTGTQHDLPELVRIYNHYIETSPSTFDLHPHAVDDRRQWFAEHSGGGRYRMLVAERSSEGSEVGGILGYACTGRFRTKAAYDPSVEASVYVDANALGHGVGAALYGELIDGLRSDPDVHRVLAGITLPNAASVALHERFGFRHIGTFGEVGLKFGRYWDVGWYELCVDGGGP
jgi:phosphinothricin acetyltransferase